MNVPECTIFERDLLLQDNLVLPASVITNKYVSSITTTVGIVLGHGLGFGNPRSKSHKKENWLPIVATAALELENLPVKTVLYTARGHGASSGWEDTAAEHPELFSWNNLSHDMANVASAEKMDKFIACGSSMGSATALFCAINYPNRVSAVIMIRPPTGWKEREARRDHIIRSANELEDSNRRKNNNFKHHLVLLGAATADLPSLDDLDAYMKVKCPVLILAVRGDDAHPEISATSIAERLTNVELTFVENFEEAASTWPNIVKTFIEKVTTAT
jgi:pimeloyl-ACP methyl ester carboxylesterase